MNQTTLTNFENNYFSANVDKFPTVLITFTGTNATDEEFEEYINCLATMYIQKEVFVILSDSRKGNYMKSKHRIDLGNWTKKNEDMIQKQCKGVAFVMSSVIIKTMLKGIFMVQAPPYKYLIVDDIEKAEEWLAKQLEK